MKYRIIVLLILGVLILQGCSNDNSQRSNDTNNASKEKIKEVQTEKPTEIPTEIPAEEPKETPKKEFTVEDDILFDTHNNDYIFIEGKNMTVDGNNSTQEIDIDNDGEKEFFKISLGTPNGTKISKLSDL